MKTKHHKFGISHLGLLALALLAAPAMAQTAIDGEATPPAISAPKATAPSVPGDLGISSVIGDAAGSASNNAAADPAVSAVLDRLKQDSTPLSISDMSMAQDTLARLNLLKEIEEKLTAIEEQRVKRQVGSMMGMALPVPGSGIPVNMPAGQYAMMSGAASADPTPKVMAISGAGGKYTAIISADGRRVNAKVGSTLPDGSRVTKISGTGVEVKNKGKVSKLAFASDPLNGPAVIEGATKN
jgi:type IV pilus biogenesis protein PilP